MVLSATFLVSVVIDHISGHGSFGVKYGPFNIFMLGPTAETPQAF